MGLDCGPAGSRITCRPLWPHFRHRWKFLTPTYLNIKNPRLKNARGSKFPEPFITASFISIWWFWDVKPQELSFLAFAFAQRINFRLRWSHCDGAKKLDPLCCAMSVHVKEHWMIENSVYFHYAVSHNHIVVLRPKILPLRHVFCRTKIKCSWQRHLAAPMKENVDGVYRVLRSS